MCRISGLRTGKDGCDGLVDGSHFLLLQEVTGEQSDYKQHDKDEDSP